VSPSVSDPTRHTLTRAMPRVRCKPRRSIPRSMFVRCFPVHRSRRDEPPQRRATNALNADPVVFCRPSAIPLRNAGWRQSGWSPPGVDLCCVCVRYRSSYGQRGLAFDASGHRSTIGTAGTTGHADERKSARRCYAGDLRGTGVRTNRSSVVSSVAPSWLNAT